jgi:uncharacterized protein (DUF2147 family)
MTHWLLALLAGAAAVSVAPQPPAGGDLVLGTWINSNSTVAVEVRNCGALICGTVVRASRSSEEDARKGGVREMVGTNVLRDFRPSGPGRWTGRVFVPERGRTLHSNLILIDRNHIQVEGCILGGLICQHEVWHRNMTQ